MAPTLVLDIQLYILNLATPSKSTQQKVDRRSFLRLSSLVHRSWTATAQRLLFRHLHIKLDDPAVTTQGIDALFDLAMEKTPFVESVELECGGGGWSEEVLEAVWRRCSSLNELTIRWDGGQPCSVPSTLLNLRSVTLVGPGKEDCPGLSLSTLMPSHLTRLHLVNVGLISSFPTCPALETLLISGTTSFFARFSFPSLRTFGFDDLTFPPPPSLYSSLPPSLERLRLRTRTFPPAFLLSPLSGLKSSPSVQLYHAREEREESRALVRALRMRCEKRGMRIALEEDGEGVEELESWEQGR